jgi:HSP20 family protein
MLKGQKMAQDKNKKNEGVDVDFGVAKLGLGGLFKGIESLVDLASKLKEAGGEINKEGEIDLSKLREGMKGVFGFSVKTAVGGKPVVESFGNVRKSAHGPTVEEEREPLTDVFDEDEEIRVYAEMPGVKEKDIQLDLKEDILDISAQSGDRKYHKEILLPTTVRAETMTSSYSNGILELKVKK